jgi:hypothetical protein
VRASGSIAFFAEVGVSDLGLEKRPVGIGSVGIVLLIMIVDGLWFISNK